MNIIITSRQRMLLRLKRMTLLPNQIKWHLRGILREFLP